MLLIVVLLMSTSLPGGSSTAGATSVLFIGDSLTLGLSAVDPEHAYQSLLLMRLRHERPVDWAESVIEHPYGLTDNAELRAAPYLGGRPRTILVEVGTHEITAPPEQQDLFERRYTHLLDHLAETRARIIVGTLPWLGYTPGSVRYREALALNQIIRREAQARGDLIVDLWRPTVGRPAILSRPEDSTFMPPFQGDFFHPGNLGHEVLADAFWPVLNQSDARDPGGSAPGPVPFVMPAAVLSRKTAATT